MKGLVLAGRDLAGTHVRSQTSPFFFAEVDQGLLQLDAEIVLTTVAGADEAIQTSQLEEFRHLPGSARPHLAEHQVGGNQDPLKKVDASPFLTSNGRFRKGLDVRWLNACTYFC